MDTAQLQALSRQGQINAIFEEISSPVQQFYSGANVLITGGSGFLGKQLLEKLLRSCNVNKVFLLLRSKKGTSVIERLQQLQLDPVFNRLREEQPDFGRKLVSVEGDVGELKLNISREDWNVLTEEVNVIFHMAATIKFNEPLRVATIINVRGTRETLALARQCKNLKKFVHVSTAYTHTTSSQANKKIYEKFESSPLAPDVMIGLVETMEEARLNAITQDLIQDWPNTYTFTKAIAEDVVQKAGADLPICVVRPAVVFCSYNEPDPGWLDQSCVYGPTGVFYGYVMGVIRTFLVDVNVGLGLVPVDYVNNAIIASAWDSSLRRGGEKVPIYTIANEESSISWKFICRVINTDEFRRTISSQALWYTYILPTNNKRYFQVLSWLLHYIPAYIVDAMASVLRIRRPKNIRSLVKVYKNVEKSRTIYEHFLTKAFHFQDQNVKGMLSRMSDKDRTIFNCDLANVNKKELIKRMSLGLRKYVVQEDLSTCNMACRKQFYFKIGNYGFLALYIYIFWILIKRIPKLSFIRYVKKFCK